MPNCTTCNNACDKSQYGEPYCIPCNNEETRNIEMNTQSTFNGLGILNLQQNLSGNSKYCMYCQNLFSLDDFHSKSDVDDEDENIDHCRSCTEKLTQVVAPPVLCSRCSMVFSKADFDLNSAQKMCCNCTHNQLEKFNNNKEDIEEEKVRQLNENKFLTHRPNEKETILLFKKSKDETGHDGPFNEMGIFSMLEDAYKGKHT